MHEVPIAPKLTWSLLHSSDVMNVKLQGDIIITPEGNEQSVHLDNNHMNNMSFHT